MKIRKFHLVNFAISADHRVKIKENEKNEKYLVAQSAGVVEYTDCFSAEG